MHTRNTTNTPKKAGVSVGRAISILELLTREDTQLVLNYFCTYHQASYLDLLIYAQLEPDRLEALLQALQKAQIIREHTTVYGTEYQLNFARMKGITRLVRCLTADVRVGEPVRV